MALGDYFSFAYWRFIIRGSTRKPNHGLHVVFVIVSQTCPKVPNVKKASSRQNLPRRASAKPNFSYTTKKQQRKKNLSTSVFHVVQNISICVLINAILKFPALTLSSISSYSVLRHQNTTWLVLEEKMPNS